MAASAQSGASQSQQPAASFQLPPIVVTAQKEPADPRTLPISVTAVAQPTIEASGSNVISDLAIQSPNVHFSEFTARKLSNPRFRGIGASPTNPAITTYFDGVPQLNSNSSSLELIDVAQVEFVRGPQSALFGRNTLGGLVNVTTVRPALDRWTGSLMVPLANHDSRDVRGSASGPLVDGRLALGLALQYGRRDGFTTNVMTGNDLDDRSAFAAKGQLLWTPTANWEARVIVNGERDRDGDYGLSDLEGLRRDPFRTARDFEGHTHRDVVGTTVLTRREGPRLTFSTTTGFVRWTSEDLTDLDYSPLPVARRENGEESFQFTQEVRLASAANAPVALSDEAALKWQTGVFLFTQNYDQNAANAFGPLFAGVPFSQHQVAELDDLGVGLYGQATVTIADRFDVSAGARVDHEQKEAVLRSRIDSPFPLGPDTEFTGDEGFGNVSPQVAVAYRIQPDKSVYASLARGFKAGGFNASAPVGFDAYGEEHTWSAEGGVKTLWAGGRVSADAAVFRIDWDDLQLNLPDPRAPAQFYIANVGGAVSTGVELELNARVHEGVDVFGILGYNRARFSDGSVSGGLDVSDNKVPNTPDYTATIGTQLSRRVHSAATVYGRAEAAFNGGFEYDDANTARQERYSLANFRAGVRWRYAFAEAWVRNAFDTRYIPIAVAYGGFAPSGFVGEMGRPRTFGITSGVSF